MSSSNLGTPRVTFLAELPAEWNVLSVIWVVGSPTDCAAIVPTISPGATVETCHLRINKSTIRAKLDAEHLVETMADAMVATT